jgi:ParB family chromosome partitioning protein
MLTTKRYEYMPIERIGIHPLLHNHRDLNMHKVVHLDADILRNGLLEPLVVWEKNNAEYYLVGGFHRMAAIERIREKNPGYFDQIDVRIVAGNLDEMRALNLKLNADRVDTKITDYFDTVIYLNNVNWGKEKIAEFLDKSVPWIEEIIRYVPGMDIRIRKMMEDGALSWNKAKAICRAVRDAPAGQEKKILEQELAELAKPNPSAKSTRKPLTVKNLKKKLSARIKEAPQTQYYVGAEDLFSLVLLLEGKEYEDAHLARVRHSFPGLLD